MAATWEAVSYGQRRFGAEDILDLELTMVISDLYIFMEMIEDEDLKKMVAEWRDKVTRVRNAIQPILNSSEMAPEDMIQQLRTLADIIKAVSIVHKKHGYLLKDTANNLRGISGALRGFYFQPSKAVEKDIRPIVDELRKIGEIVYLAFPDIRKILFDTADRLSVMKFINE